MLSFYVYITNRLIVEMSLVL